MDEKIRQALEDDLRMTLDRFVDALDGRLPSIEPDSLERYFAMLSKLVEKLEDESKGINQIMTEMMTEAAGLLMAEMQARRG